MVPSPRRSMPRRKPVHARWWLAAALCLVVTGAIVASRVTYRHRRAPSPSPPRITPEELLTSAFWEAATIQDGFDRTRCLASIAIARVDIGDLVGARQILTIIGEKDHEDVLHAIAYHEALAGRVPEFREAVFRLPATERFGLIHELPVYELSAETVGVAAEAAPRDSPELTTGTLAWFAGRSAKLGKREQALGLFERSIAAAAAIDEPSKRAAAVFSTWEVVEKVGLERECRRLFVDPPLSLPPDARYRWDVRSALHRGDVAAARRSLALIHDFSTRLTTARELAVVLHRRGKPDAARAVLLEIYCEAIRVEQRERHCRVQVPTVAPQTLEYLAGVALEADDLAGCREIAAAGGDRGGYGRLQCVYLLVRRGRTGEAIRLCRRISRTDSGAAAWAAVGWALDRQGERARASAAFQEARKSAARIVDGTAKYLAQAYIMAALGAAGRLDEALDVALQIEPERRSLLLQDLAEGYAWRGDDRGVLCVVRAEPRTDSRVFQLMYGALIYQKRGEHEAGRRLVRLAAEHARRDGSWATWGWLASAQEAAGLRAEALHSFDLMRTACNNDPTYRRQGLSELWRWMGEAREPEAARTWIIELPTPDERVVALVTLAEALYNDPVNMPALRPRPYGTDPTRGFEFELQDGY